MFNRLLKRIWMFFFNIYVRIKFKKVKIGANVRIRSKSEFGGCNRLGDNVIFFGKMGRFSYIGNDSLVVGKVGSFCSIAPHVSFITSAHPTSKWISTSPAFYSTKKQCGTTLVKENLFNENPKKENEKCSIIVGNDVYIGFGAVLIGPITVGDGAVIAAGAVVTHDVGPYEIVGGVPAKLIKKRFSDQDIEDIIKSDWWNKGTETLEANAKYFNDIENFRKIDW